LAKHLGDRAAFVHERLTEEPVVVEFFMAQQNVQFVVAKDTLRLSGSDEFRDKVDNSRTVGTAVGQVAKKNEASACRVQSRRGVTQLMQRLAQGVQLSVDVPDNVDRAIEEGLNKLHEGSSSTTQRFLAG
jgi:hypothetical protein